MRMPPVTAVVFDYGRTLVTFDYPKAELAEVVERFRPAIAEATGVPAPAVDDIVSDVLVPLEAVVDDPAEDEVEYLEIFAAAWRRAGLTLPRELLYEILDAEQQVWDRAACIAPDAIPLLEWLAARGYRRAICSNAPFPGEMMRRQVVHNGLAALVDAVVFSSEIGRRKPAPQMYGAALDAIDVRPEQALFVGDRVREDYDGPRALGMRAVICTAYAVDRPGPDVPTIESLREVSRFL
jgi:HAD superfamily hydrolase (TIGR01509 family)